MGSPTQCKPEAADAPIGHEEREALLTVKQVAERLGVAKSTVYALCARGELKHVRVANAVRVSETDLASFIDGAAR